VSLPKLSVERPVLTTMVTLIVVVLGAVSLSRLQIDMLPEIELPTLTVDTEYEGASPEVMERRVTRIVEEIVGTVPGVEEMSSESSRGESEVRVRFEWGKDIDTAALDVQSKLEDEISELPEDIVRPRIRKFDVSSFPVVLMGISSELDPVELTTLVEEQLRHRFSQIPGVAQVDPWGSYEREVRVELDPGRVKALGLPLDEVLDALRSSNVDLPTGEIDQGTETVTLRRPRSFRASTTCATRWSPCATARPSACARSPRCTTPTASSTGSRGSTATSACGSPSASSRPQTRSRCPSES